jgi:hypothetical protein
MKNYLFFSLILFLPVLIFSQSKKHNSDNITKSEEILLIDTFISTDSDLRALPVVIIKDTQLINPFDIYKDIKEITAHFINYKFYCVGYQNGFENGVNEIKLRFLPKDKCNNISVLSFSCCDPGLAINAKDLFMQKSSSINVNPLPNEYLEQLNKAFLNAGLSKSSLQKWSYPSTPPKAYNFNYGAKEVGFLCESTKDEGIYDNHSRCHNVLILLDSKKNIVAARYNYGYSQTIVGFIDFDKDGINEIVVRCYNANSKNTYYTVYKIVNNNFKTVYISETHSDTY